MKGKIPALFMAFLLTMLPLVGADAVSVSASVSKAISVTFQYSAVAFGSLTQGINDNAPTPSYTTGEYNVTVDTNFAYQSSVSGTAFTGSTSSFVVGNLTVDTNETKGNLSPTQAVTGSPTVVGTSPTTGIGIDDFHGYLLDIPAYQYSEAYSSTITWTYANQ